MRRGGSVAATWPDALCMRIGSSLTLPYGEGVVKRSHGFGKRLEVPIVIDRHRLGRPCEVVQDLREQPIVDVQMNSLMRAGITRPFQRERDTGLVEVCVEAG